MEFYHFLKQIFSFILNILFPIKCLGCQTKDKILCDYCISKIKLAERETDEKIEAIFDYRDPLIKKVIWELKYHHKRYLGYKLGELLYENLMESIEDIRVYTPGKKIIVIPVPISRKKIKLRGYNQALTIARGFCSSNKKIFELENNIIIKKINTIPQAKITNRKRRLENVKNVFEIKDKEKIKNRTIIIIDDVTTTGGTINEIIRILKKAQAKRAVGFAVAH